MHTFDALSACGCLALISRTEMATMLAHEAHRPPTLPSERPVSCGLKMM